MSGEQAWSRAWWAEKLIIPIFIGFAIFVVQFVAPRFFVKEMELSIQIQEPVTYIDSAITQDFGVKVNDQVVTDLLTYHARIWNSGDLPLKDIPARFVFQSTASDFQILRVTHKTAPAFEFGAIKEEDPNNAERRFVYTLLNPSDEDLVTFWVNREAKLTPFAKSEGMALRIVAPPKPSTSIRTMSLAEAFFYGVLGAMLIEVVSIYNLFLYRRREHEPPVWVRSPFYWVVRLIMTLCGGVIVVVYVSSGISLTPLLALTLGAAAPLLIQHLVVQNPRIELGSLND